MIDVLIIEDDREIAELVRDFLVRDGYVCKIANSGEMGISIMRQDDVRLVLLDLMLPGLPGSEVCRSLRERSSVPVIMLTAKDTEMDRVTGLDRGADDYVAKPFGIMELGARIRSVLRRAAPAPASETMTFAGLSINPKTREVVRDGTALELTPKEYDLLLRLAVERDRIVTREELLKSVWGYNFMGETRTLDIHVRSLRQKLGDDADNPAFIKTARGVGYRFVGEMA